MKPRFLNTLAAAALLGATALTAATGAMAQEVTLKLHQFLPAQANVPKLILDEWIARVEKDAGGKLEIEHYPAMQLGGKPPELVDQLRDGVIDLTWTVIGYTPGRFPSTEAFELPFMMTNGEQTSKAFHEYCEKYCVDDFKDYHVIA